MRPCSPANVKLAFPPGFIFAWAILLPSIPPKDDLDSFKNQDNLEKAEGKRGRIKKFRVQDFLDTPTFSPSSFFFSMPFLRRVD